MTKLNAQITQQQQADAGVTEYVWRTVGDGRVRESHRHLNGKQFKYSDSPVVDTKTGRRANPGEDYILPLGGLVWQGQGNAESGGRAAVKPLYARCGGCKVPRISCGQRNVEIQAACISRAECYHVNDKRQVGKRPLELFCRIRRPQHNDERSGVGGGVLV